MGKGIVHLAVGNLSDRRFQIFAVSSAYPQGQPPDNTPSNNLYSSWKPTKQPGEPWADWERWISQYPNGGPGLPQVLQAAARSCAVQLYDYPGNRPMVMAIDTIPSGTIWVTWKLSTNADSGWAGWTEWNGLPSYKDLAAARLIGFDPSQGIFNPGIQGVGRAQIFGVTDGGSIQTFWQVSDNVTNPSQFSTQFYPSPPQDFSLPGVSANQITAAELWSGQIQVWAVDANGMLWSRWKKYDYANPQDPDMDWVDWQMFAASDPTPQVPYPVRQISSSRLSDGTVQLFALTDPVPLQSQKSQIWSSWQQYPQTDSGWTAWSEFPPILIDNDPNYPGQQIRLPLLWTAAGLSVVPRTQLWALSQPNWEPHSPGQMWTCWDNGAGTGWSQWQSFVPAVPGVI